ncbi:MAG TPA: hypothetical protein VM285_10170 [Polyangia bacterium]|nr:hypothetical protein [Polyangia bacterium]
MASNNVRWLKNLLGAKEPLIILGLFQAGATKAVKKGEILELTADTNTRWVPMDSDFAGNANVAIANEEIKSGDRAGYYEIIVIRPGDVFEFDLAAAGGNALGTALYWSDSETLTITAGSNILAYIADQDHYPLKQGHLADDGSPDSGETLRSTSKARVTFKEAVSYLKVFQIA